MVMNHITMHLISQPTHSSRGFYSRWVHRITFMGLSGWLMGLEPMTLRINLDSSPQNYQCVQHTAVRTALR